MNVVNARRLARWQPLFVACVAVASLTACGGGGGGSSAPQTDRGQVRSYLSALPTWGEFSPALPDLQTAGTEQPAHVDMVDTQQYSCRLTPWTVQKTPEEIVLYSPTAILWPGALLQGKTYRDANGLSDVLPLTIAERAEINVSIPAFTFGTNYRTVVPNQATVASAVGDLVAEAGTASFVPASSSTFRLATYSSSEQFALDLGLAGKYLNFEGSAGFSYSQVANQTTVVMHFTERMFEVVVEAPQTPDAFFSDAFTKAKLDEQVSLGKIGADNVPVYVSSVSYGRMITFSVTAAATESELKAALSAAYDAGAGNISFDANASWAKLIQSSEVKILSLGGPLAATAEVIKTGDWSTYFAEPAPLSTAVPIAFTLRSVGDGSIARVSEVTTYDREDCTALQDPQFLALQTVLVQVPVTGLKVSSGDFNGDGRMDLVWNSLATANEVQVAFGKPDGTFGATARAVTLDDSRSWTGFNLVSADMNGDGKEDLVWNKVTTGTSQTYIAISDGIGGFALRPVLERTGAEWVTSLAFTAARVLYKPGTPTPADLLWFRVLDTPANTAQVIASLFDATGLSNVLPVASIAGTGLAMNTTFGTLVGDLDGNGADDFAWGTAGNVSVALNDGAGGFIPATGMATGLPCHIGTNGACPVESGFRIGDVNGDARADILRFDDSYRYSDTETRAIAQVLLSNDTGGFTAETAQYGWTTPWDVHPYLRDVTGDGRADLVWIDRSRSAIWIAPSVVSAGAFTGFGTGVPYNLPAIDTGTYPGGWNSFREFIGDVNGDGRADLVFANENAQAGVLVRLD